MNEDKVRFHQDNDPYHSSTYTYSLSSKKMIEGKRFELYSFQILPKSPCLTDYPVNFSVDVLDIDNRINIFPSNYNLHVLFFSARYVNNYVRYF